MLKMQGEDGEEDELLRLPMTPKPLPLRCLTREEEAEDSEAAWMAGETIDLHKETAETIKCRALLTRSLVRRRIGCS